MEIDFSHTPRIIPSLKPISFETKEASVEKVSVIENASGSLMTNGVKNPEINPQMVNSNQVMNKKTLKRERTRMIMEHRTRTLLALISNLYLSKKFIKILKTLTSWRTPDFLARHNFDIINDLTFFYEIWKRKDYPNRLSKNNENIFGINSQSGEKIKKRIKTFVKKVKVFEKSSFFIIIWNVLHLFLILIFFFVIPLEKSYAVKLSSNFQDLSLIEQGAFYFFLADIGVSMNTAVYIKGKLIKTRKEILENYIRNHFFRDTLSILSIFTRIYLQYDSLLELLFFLRILNFNAIIKHIEEMLFIDQSSHNILSLVKLISRIIFLSHIFSCLWYYVGSLNINKSWISNEGMIGSDWWILYLNSFYFVCITMNTVGYGDISPQNSYEKIFSIVFTYMACGLFAYSLNSIGMIVSDIAKRSNEFQKKLKTINGYMKQKKINADLRMRVNKYLEYICYEEKVEQLEEESQIIGQLSEALKQELLLEANSEIIRNIKLFSRNFSEDLLSALIPILTEVRFTPGDIIFSKGEIDLKSLYILRKGQIEIFQEINKPNSSVTVLKTLKAGQTFGELSFFSSQPCVYSARSVDFTSAYMINKVDFVKLLKKYPFDYEKFCEIRDNINLYENFQPLYLKCHACQCDDHLAHQCPNLFYPPKREIIVRRFAYSREQQRNPLFKRKGKFLQFRSLSQFKEIQEKIMLYQDEILSPTEENNETGGECTEDYFAESYNSIKADNPDFSKLPKIEENENEERDEVLKIEKSEKSVKNQKSGETLTNPEENTQNNTDPIGFQNPGINKRMKSKKIVSYQPEVLFPAKAKLEDMDRSPKARKSMAALQRSFVLASREEIQNNIDSMHQTEKNKTLVIEVAETHSTNMKALDLDTVKVWDAYCPYNNCSRVAERVNSINKLRVKEKKKKAHKMSVFSPEKCGKSFVFNSLNEMKAEAKLLENPSPPKSSMMSPVRARKSFFKKGQNLELKAFDIKSFKLQYKDRGNGTLRAIYKNIIGRLFKDLK